jgi:hypothetical protein
MGNLNLRGGFPYCLGPGKLEVDAWILQAGSFLPCPCPRGESEVSQSPGWHGHGWQPIGWQNIDYSTLDWQDCEIGLLAWGRFLKNLPCAHGNRPCT